MRVIKNYYWNTHKNWGDGLNPYLLKRFAGVDSEWDTVSHAEVIAIGSVLEHVPPLWDGHIVGAGKLYGDSRLHLYTNTATIWALRGPLSASGVPGDFAIGDPGLLADELVADDVDTKTYDLGVLPHWSDHELIHNPHWYNDRWSTRLIFPGQHPLSVVREISKCRKIVTSSLHGIIVADACGIPRRLEFAKAMKAEGNSYKFEDYSRSIGAPLEFGRVFEAERFQVEDRKHEIYDAFTALGRHLRQT